MVQERTTIQREHPPLQVTSDVKSQLLEIAHWALALSAIGFVITIVILISATYSSINMGILRGGAGQSSIFTGVGYLIVGGFTLIPITAIYKFGTFLKLALNNEDQSAMDRAFLNLKSGLRYCGLAAIALPFFWALATYMIPYL